MAPILKSRMKRKPKLNPEEIVLNFKENKFDNANVILILLKDLLEPCSVHHQLNCISSLTDVMLQNLKDGDIINKKHQKHDDLKNAIEKYRDRITERFDFIFSQFLDLLHHSNRRVSEQALLSLMTVIQHTAWRTRLFPYHLYKRVLLQLLSPRVDCRKVIAHLKEPLQFPDLVLITFKYISEHLAKQKLEDGKSKPQPINSVAGKQKLAKKQKLNGTSKKNKLIIDITDIYKSNLLTLLVLMKVPSKEVQNRKTELWCSTRKSSKAAKLKAINRYKYEQGRKSKLNLNAEENADISLDISSNDGNSSDDDSIADDSNTDSNIPDDRTTSNGAQLLDDFDIDSDEEQIRKDDRDFKSGQKIKPQRKRKQPELSIEAQPDNYEPEDVNQITIGERKRIKLSAKPMLPPEAFDDAASRAAAAANCDAGSIAEDNQSEDSEVANDLAAFEGLPRELRGPLFVYSYDEACGYLTTSWDTVLNVLPLTDEQYKRCLIFVPDHVMDHHKDPVSMANFFFECYERGGSISILAMKGAFFLIHKHDLHRPDFYPKVYKLLEPSVFNARYKGRFFVLLSMFLSSSHLPEYIAAAFVKRMSLLALRSPANCTILLVKCINNVLTLFPSLRILFDDVCGSQLEQDPYSTLEDDLKYSGAADSSLWELAAVSKAASEKLYKACYFIKKTNAPEETDISPNLETEYDEVDTTSVEHANNFKKASVSYKYGGKMMDNTTNDHATFFC